MSPWTIIGVGVHCTLGDPKGENIIVPGFTQRQVRAEEAKAKGAQKLALHLMDVFFTRDKMATGLCTKWEGREQLDPDIIEGIRCKWMWNYAVCSFLDENVKPYQSCIYITLISISVHINYRYPLDSKDTSTDRWKKVLEAMNNKCRNVRNSKKPPQKPSEA